MIDEYMHNIRVSFHLYSKHVAVLFPLMLITGVGLLLDRIPYANLYKDMILTGILVFDWVVILWLSRLTPRTMISVAMLLFVLTVPLHYLRLDWYVEILGNLSYIIIFLAIFFEMIRDLGNGKNRGNHIESQRELFNKEFADISNSFPAAWQRSYLDRIQQYLLTKKKSGAKVIELGCGDGKLSVALAKVGYDVTACDISDTSISLVKKFSKEAHVNVHAVQCDVTKLPFRDGEFDFAIAGAILEHLEDEKTALSEWSRVLKKGGRIMIVTPLRQRHVLPIWWILNWFHDRRLGHVRRYDYKRYEALKTYGLKLDKVIYTGHTPKVLLTILYMIIKRPSIEELAENVDVAFESFEYDGNNIIGFFTRL